MKWIRPTTTERVEMFYSYGILICIGKFAFLSLALTLHKNCISCQFQAQRGSVKSFRKAPQTAMERLLGSNFPFYRCTTKHAQSLVFSASRPESAHEFIVLIKSSKEIAHQGQPFPSERQCSLPSPHSCRQIEFYFSFALSAHFYCGAQLQFLELHSNCHQC
jgi:hypothetical protein